VLICEHGGKLIASIEKQRKIMPVFVAALGDSVREALAHEHCEDVARNADGILWAKLTGADFVQIGEQSDDEAYRLIAHVAALQGANVSFDRPKLETVLPDGNRFEGVLPPVSRTPVWTIRKRSTKIYSLGDYVISGIMDLDQFDAIVEALIKRQNILVSGSNGSGKTSLLNALIAELTQFDPKARLGIIEDNSELQASLPNHIAFLAGPKASMQSCLKTCLRMRLDRIAVGEVRGREALTMLKAFNTGYPGMATIHANSASAAKQRLCMLVREAIPNFDATAMVEDNIHLIIHIDGPTATRGRRISELLKVGK
jgi:type IV secretion system protein TrbB